jgi:GLPGLI family protein
MKKKIILAGLGNKAFKSLSQKKFENKNGMPAPLLRGGAAGWCCGGGVFADMPPLPPSQEGIRTARCFNISFFFLFAFLMSAAAGVQAQHTHFTTSGTIEFERKTNAWAVIKKEINKDNEAFVAPALENYKKNNPQFRVLKSTLSFTGNKTLFTPIDADPASNIFFISIMPLLTQNNIIYSDLNNGLTIAQRKVLGDAFLVSDSTRKIKWKITDETRDIAGYHCRRANGIMLDSIYVVAFYTTQIPVPGGPESFNGLPGMILGVALPHENLAWFATKVTDTTLPDNAINPPKKGKKTDDKGFVLDLQTAMKDQGQMAADFVRQALF